MVPFRRRAALASIALLGTFLASDGVRAGGMTLENIPDFVADMSQVGPHVDTLPEPQGALRTADLKRFEGEELGVEGLDLEAPNFMGMVEALPTETKPLQEAARLSDVPISLHLGWNGKDRNGYDGGSTLDFVCFGGVMVPVADIPLSFGWWSNTGTALVTSGYANFDCGSSHEIVNMRTRTSQTIDFAPQVEVGAQLELQNLVNVGGYTVSPFVNITADVFYLGNHKLKDHGSGQAMTFDLDEERGQAIGAKFGAPWMNDCRFFMEYRTQQRKIQGGMEKDMGRQHESEKTQNVIAGIEAPFGSTCLTPSYHDFSLAGLFPWVNLPSAESPWYVTTSVGHVERKGATKGDVFGSLTIGADMISTPAGWGEARFVMGPTFEFRTPTDFSMPQDSGGWVDVADPGEFAVGLNARLDKAAKLDTSGMIGSDLYLGVGGNLRYNGVTTETLGRDIPSKTKFADGTEGRSHNDILCEGGVGADASVYVTPEGGPTFELNAGMSRCRLVHNSHNNGGKTHDEAYWRIGTTVRGEALYNGVRSLFGGAER